MAREVSEEGGATSLLSSPVVVVVVVVVVACNDDDEEEDDDDADEDDDDCATRAAAAWLIRARTWETSTLGVVICLWNDTKAPVSSANVSSFITSRHLMT